MMEEPVEPGNPAKRCAEQPSRPGSTKDTQPNTRRGSPPQRPSAEGLFH
jgi:hypothetical protein